MPQISLNHLVADRLQSSLSTALYVSIGCGNGYSGLGDAANRKEERGAVSNDQ